MRLALPACLSGPACPGEVPVMDVKLQAPSCHLTSYNDRHLCLWQGCRYTGKVYRSSIPKSNTVGPTEVLAFPVAAQTHWKQSRSTGAFTRCGLCAREHLFPYETVHRAPPKTPHVTKWGCLQNHDQLGNKPRCIHFPSFSASILFPCLFCSHRIASVIEH